MKMMKTASLTVIALLLMELLQVTSSCFCGREPAAPNHGNEGESAGVQSPAASARIPWSVAITARYGRFTSFLCGGSLINDRYILTAARCVHMFPANMIGVTLGAMTSNHTISMPTLAVSNIIIHEKYARYFRRRRKHVFNDVALLRLMDPIPMDGLFVPICLPTTDVKDTAIAVSGWGYPSHSRPAFAAPQLTETPVKELDPGLCSRFFSRALRYNDKSTICATGSVGVCYKDEGTPLVTRRDGYVFQTGLVSVSRGFADCGYKPRVPTIFEKVVSHMEWIRGKTNDARWCWTPGQTRVDREEENEIKSDDFFKDFKSFNEAKEVQINHRKTQSLL